MAQDAPTSARAMLLGLVDPGFRLSLPGVGSERAFRISLAAVALVYTLAFASLFVLEPENGAAVVDPRGQIEGPPSINVEIVDAPALDAASKVSRAGNDTPPQPNEMNLPLPPAPPVPPAELTPPQPPVAEAVPEPAEPTPQPKTEPAEKPEKAKKQEMVLDGIDLSMKSYADAIDAAVERRKREREQRQSSQPSTAFVGGASSIKAAAKSGKTDAYSQSVIAALLRTKPAPFALRGSVMVSFEILPDGSLKFVHMLHTSGNTAMDQVAVAAIRRAKFDPPPAGATPSDLTYIIHYIFE